MRKLLRICSLSLIILACNNIQRVYSQPFSLAGIAQHTAASSPASNCNITISSAGGGTQQWQGSSIGTNGIGGTGGSVAQNCANQTGLRLEMSGAGNSSGTGVWNNSITVTVTFPQGVKGPVTFSIYDLTEPWYNDGSYNYAYYQDKVTISSTKCDGTAVTPTLTSNNGPITSATVGSSLVLTALRLQGACNSEPVSIGTAADLIKTVTIVYANQDPPTNVPAPVGSPARYGISQYQYVFISNINASPPDPIIVTATPNPVCTGQTTTLNASSTTAYTYSWASGTTPTTGSTVTATPAATTTYTVTGTVGTCTESNSITVNVNNGITPTFTALGPYCQGAVPVILPTTSNNGITGTWNPSTISTASLGTTVYTFTPTAGQCATTTTMNVIVNSGITPAFTALGPYCQGAAPGVLPATSTNGITGTWNPSTISTATTGTTVYTFTPTAGQCATTTTMSVIVNPNITPAFTALGPYCVGAAPGTLPAISTNGINGTWNPATISTAAAGTTVYTFTPTAGQCATTITMSVTVSTNITPTFTTLGPYCVGAVPGVLPANSTNGISGTWNPAIISTAAAGTTVYTFTPTAGQCAANTTMSVTVNTNITPTFTALGPYCVGSVPGMLPTTSTNAINGTWNPTAISTATAGITVYTFTPTAGQCATTTTLSVTVNANITPAFAALGPYCIGAVPVVLPITSTNGISGTWNPATISTSAAGTTVYTFTPTAGQCATTTTMSVTVSTNITPTFTALGPYCVGSTPAVLPTTSTNGYTGTWNPATISTATAGTTVYTFTPTAGQCATTTIMSVTVSASILPTFTNLGPYCAGAIPAVLPATSTNGINGTWNPSTISTATAGTTVHTFTPAAGQCAATTTMSITVNANTTPAFTALGPYCAGTVAGVLPITSTNGINGTWNPATISTTTPGTVVYTFTPSAGICATTTTLSVTVNANVTPAFAALGPYCVGATPGILSATSTNGITGTWNPATISTATAGTTIYTFTPAAGVCAITATMNVVVNAAVVPDFPAIPVFCSGDVAPVLNATSPNGISGTWTPPSVDNTTGGTYTFTPNASQCATTQTLTTTVNPLPVVTISSIPVQPVICVGQGTSLTGSGATTYVWIPGNLTGSLVDVYPVTTTVYTVTGTALGCTSSATVTVNVNPLPTVTVNPSSICAGETSQLTAGGADTYLWTPGSQSGNSITVSPAVTTIYTVTGTSATGCTGSVSVTVTVNPAPQVSANANPASICNGQCTDLSASGAANYTWQPVGLNGQTIQVCPNTNTTYTVTGTSAAGCSASQTVSVSVSTTIAINVNPQADSVCAGSGAVLTASGGSTYIWTPANTLSSSTGNQVVASPLVNTVYTVLGNNGTGCTGSTTATVSVYPDVPMTFSMWPSEGCEPLTVNFGFDTTNTLIDLNSLQYYFDDPSSGNNTSTDAYTTHVFNQHGFYTVRLTATTIYGCQVSYTDTVKVYRMPIADFYTHPEQIEINDPTVYFYDQSYYATTWNWNFGDPHTIDNITSDHQNPVHIYSDTGNYQIVLIVSNGHNCFDTAVRNIHIFPQFLFWIPNAFTANDDNKNNTFYGKGVGFRTDDFEMYVYDRWGKLMFGKTGYDELGWDGTYQNKGKLCEQGVYTYLIKLTEINGIKHTYKGVVILIQ
jgi:gliding motility-associated-like protein